MASYCWMWIVEEELRTHLERYLLKTVEICSEALPALFGEGDIILCGNEKLSTEDLFVGFIHEGR